MIPLRSRSDSLTFTPRLSAIGSETNFSRSPSRAFRLTSACARGRRPFHVEADRRPEVRRYLTPEGRCVRGELPRGLDRDVAPIGPWEGSTSDIARYSTGLTLAPFTILPR